MTEKEKLDKLVAEIKRLAQLHLDMREAYKAVGNTSAAATENVLYGHDLSILSLIDSMQEEPKFKLGDIVRRKSDGLEARVINIVDGTYIVECEDWNDSILEHQWELVEEQEPRYPSFEESQGECHPFQDIALNG